MRPSKPKRSCESDAVKQAGFKCSSLLIDMLLNFCAAFQLQFCRTKLNFYVVIFVPSSKLPFLPWYLWWTMAIDSENLVTLISSQLSHLTLVLSLIIIPYSISFNTMYSSLNLALFQPSYLRYWHSVEDSKILVFLLYAESNEPTQLHHYSKLI